MAKDPQKHTKLPRPAGGDWGRLEVALIGAPCSVLEAIAAEVVRRLPEWRIGYADAAHAEALPASGDTAVRFLQTGAGAVVHFKDRSFSPARSALFQACDLVLVNGNHFSAQQQIVFVHPEKSLATKLDRLTNVQLVVAATAATAVPEALQPVLHGVPRLLLEDIESIVQFFEKALLNSRPVLNGLVLAGGQSQRMGSDKGLLHYHAKPQRAHLFDLLQPLCRDVFVSCNAAQAAGIHLPKLEDRFLGLGPMGGLLSAFQAAPDAAWLTVATDLPHLRSTTLETLIAHRNPSKLATAFFGTDGLPEPLLTIWEPRAYPVLLQALSRGLTCPRKVLLSGAVEMLQPPQVAELQNINHPAERDAALAALHAASHPA